jgi:type II secretion system protein H
MQASKGFTLLELLVVVVVITLVTAVVLPGLARQNPERKVQIAVDRLQMVINEMCQRAERDGRVLAMALGRDSYAVMRRNPDLRSDLPWLAFAKQGVMAEASLPDPLAMRLWLNEREVRLPEKLPLRPQLICAGSSAPPPFAIRVGHADSARLLSTNAEIRGELLVQRAEPSFD